MDGCWQGVGGVKDQFCIAGDDRGGNNCSDGFC